MYSTIRKFAERGIIYLSGAINAIVVILMLVMTLGAFSQVVQRYVLRSSSAEVIELVRYSLVWLCFFGITIGLLENSHPCVEIFISRLSKRWRRGIFYVVELLTLFLLLALVLGGLRIWRSDWSQTTPALSMPFSIVNGLVVVGAGCAFFIQLLRLLRGIPRS